MKVLFKASETNMKFAKMAMDVQYACNGMGVLNSLLANMERFRETETRDTDVCNQHPALILVLDKLCSLARYHDHAGDMIRFGDAYNACRELIDGKDVEFEVHPL